MLWGIFSPFLSMISVVLLLIPSLWGFLFLILGMVCLGMQIRKFIKGE